MDSQCPRCGACNYDKPHNADECGADHRLEGAMILINGATGGIGSDLTEYLTEKGLKWVRSSADVTDKGAVWAEFARVKPEAVIHLAAIVGTKECNDVPAQAIQTNVNGAYHVASAAAAHGARMVYFSSSAIFLPPQNGGDFPLTEESPINHMNPMSTIYGTTKYWGERLARKYVPRRDLIVVRPCMGFGGRKDKVSQLVALIRSHWTRKPVNLLLDMKRMKDYCPTRNISHAVYLMLEHGAWGETFNVGYDAPEPYQETIDKIKSYGLDPAYYTHPEYDFLGDHSVSIDKLCGTLNYGHLMSRDAGIDAAVEACRKEFEG